MFALIIGLAVLWVVLAIVGILVKTLAWLVVVAIVLFILTIAAGAIHAMTTKS